MAVITFCVSRSRGKMYIAHTRLCVCPSPHSHTTAWTKMWLGGMVVVPSSHALLGRFAIGAQLLLLWQQSAERKMSLSACTHSMPGLMLLTDRHAETLYITLQRRILASSPEFKCTRCYQKTWLQQNPPVLNWRC